jgi:hypothetical protein
LHREERDAILLTTLMQRENCRMLDARKGARFGAKSCAGFRRAEFGTVQRFERDLPLRLTLPCTIDDPHTALRNHVDQVMVAKLAE